MKTPLIRMNSVINTKTTNIRNISFGETKEILTKLLYENIHINFPNENILYDIIIMPAKSEFGDYQTNIAMLLSKSLKMKPIDIANIISNTFIKDNIIDNIKISGPGFINFHLNHNYIKKKLLLMFFDKNKKFNIKTYQNYNKKVIIDFSSPNIAKEMHVGHLRSTIIGDTLSRILEFLDFNVLRLNHIGDWGTQFGMLIYYIKIYKPNVFNQLKVNSLKNNEKTMNLNEKSINLNEKTVNSNEKSMNLNEKSINLNENVILNELIETEIGDLVLFYKTAKKLFDENEDFKESSKKEVRKYYIL